MKIKTTATILLALLTISLLGLATISKPALSTPDTIQVSPSESIQAAINAASLGDTILVAAGTYNENVVVNKTVTLRGSGQGATFIRAVDTSRAAIEIKSNNANISEFTIQRGIVGVSLFGYNASIISNNTIISNSNQGIYLQLSHNNIIANNTISLNKFEGVFLENSTSNVISHNNITQNANVGIDLVYSSQNQISNNTISFHLNATLHNQGIWLESSNNNTVRSNIISSNAYDIDMFLSDNNTIVRNIISGSQYGISLDESQNNAAHHNNFLYNKRQVSSFKSSNHWDNGTQGNYWTDYTGTDANSDGIGDTPYLITEDNPDRFPLMKPLGIIIDNTPPTTTNDYDGSWHTADFVINLTAYDDISGIKATYYRINGVSAISNVSARGQPVINTESANNTLEYWSIDGFSNEEKPHHNLTDIKLDKTPPSGSIQIGDGEAYTASLPVTLHLSATDLLSGITQMRFGDNGTSWSIWESYNTSKVWNLPSGDGLKSVYVEYKDRAGEVSLSYSDTTILDTVAPVVSITSPLNGSEIRLSNAIIKWNGTDAGSGIGHFEIQLDQEAMINVGNNMTQAFDGLGDGSHIVYVKAVDKIGRTTETSVTFVVNTSPIGGVGYLEEAIIIVVVAVAIGAIVCIVYLRRKRQLKPKNSV